MSTSASGPSKGQWTSAKVLVVEDDEFQLSLLCEQLRQLGMTDVTTAHNGEQALERVKGRVAEFRLILLDLHMPGIDGFDLMERLQAAGFTGGLVIVTGQSDDVRQGASLVARARRFQLLGTVGKPVDRAVLASVLSRLG